MEAKLARASHRHRQLNIHHIQRQRSAAIRLQPTSQAGLPQHHPVQHGSPQKDSKLAEIRQHRIKASDIIADPYLVPSRPAALGNTKEDHDQDEHGLTASVEDSDTSRGERNGWRDVVSLEEVMVEKKPARKRDESFELVCPPTSRVIVLDDEPERFPAHLPEKDDGWEKIGLDGEPDHEPTLVDPITPARSWVGVVLGLAAKKA